MNKKRQILFIPGLGDEKTLTKVRHITSRWDNDKTEVTFFEAKWHSSESPEDKYKRLSEVGKKLENPIIIGVSAGASLAVRYYEDNTDIKHLYLIAGKFRHPERIGWSFQKRAPSLKALVKLSDKAISILSQQRLKQITSYRGLFDGVIKTSEMKIPGATNKLVPVIWHVFIITYVLITMPLRYRLVR